MPHLSDFERRMSFLVKSTRFGGDSLLLPPEFETECQARCGDITGWLQRNGFELGVRRPDGYRRVIVEDEHRFNEVMQRWFEIDDWFFRRTRGTAA